VLKQVINEALTSPRSMDQTPFAGLSALSPLPSVSQPRVDSELSARSRDDLFRE